MGECIFTRREAKIKKLPVLNGNYPTDATTWHGEQATFSVAISEAGVPDEYTYQWYRDGSIWTGASHPTVSWHSASIGSHSIYCIVTNKAGSVRSRTATLTVKDPAMYYSYTGTAEKIDDGNGNWRIKLKTSGVFRFTSLGNWNGLIDVFCVGGGCAGGGGTNGQWNAGGGYGKAGSGGYTTTQKNVQAAANVSYNIVIGAGGQSTFASGGNTYAFDVAAGGGTKLGGGSGGGGAGGNGSRQAVGGAGGGGNGGWSGVYPNTPPSDGTANTGGGGGGYMYVYSGTQRVGKGGSGIVVIRNHR